MKKMKKGPKRMKPKGRPRNAAVAATASAPRRSRAIARVAPPPWKTLGAAVAGSVGSAIASGVIVNQKVAEPETVAMLMAVGGGIAAYLTDGNARVAATGVAAAGAGQLALAKLGKAALKKVESAEQAAKAQTASPAQAVPQAQPQHIPPQPPPPPPPEPAPRPRGGTVVQLFREYASDLDQGDPDDAWRNEPAHHDLNGADGDGPIEIDLDLAA